MSERPPPLIRLLATAAQHMDRRMLESQRVAGFTDIRSAHSAVFANVPPEGIRLTQLASRASMSKQAMSELVDDLERLGYLQRTPDPTDGRSKLIGFTERGWASVERALASFDELEAELANQVGSRKVADLRKLLGHILEEGVAPDS